MRPIWHMQDWPSQGPILCEGLVGQGPQPRVLDQAQCQIVPTGLVPHTGLCHLACRVWKFGGGGAVVVLSPLYQMEIGC